MQYHKSHSDCIRTQRSKVSGKTPSAQQEAVVFPGSWETHSTTPTLLPPAPLFSENQPSEPESSYSKGPKSFPISMGAPAQRVSRRLFSSARPLSFSALHGLPRRSLFSLRGHHGAPNARPREGRGRGAARRGASRQWPSGRKSAASGAADWLSGWRLCRPPRQFRAGWRGIGRLRDHGACARR